jgi:hypothetical protein
MDLLVCVVILCVLGYLAARFGYDSREAPHSKEHDLANFGMEWGLTSQLEELRGEAAQWRLVHRNGSLATKERSPGRALAMAGSEEGSWRFRVRRRMAFGLRAVAYWLSPELAASAR